MSSPPRFPLTESKPPFCCVVKATDKFAYADVDPLVPLLDPTGVTDDDNDRELGELDFNTRKRHADEVVMIDCETKRRNAEKQTPDESQEEGVSDDTDIKMVDTPDEEDDNNLANQLQLRDTAGQIPVTQGLATHLDSANELPLPSPSASPKQSSSLDDYQTVKDLLPKETQDVISKIENYATGSLPPSGFNNLVYRLIRKTDRSALSDILNSINSSLQRDLITSFPPEISQEIIKNFDYTTLCNVMLVSKSWRKLVNTDTWKHMLLRDEFVTPEELIELKPKFEKDPSFYQKLYIKRRSLFQNWVDPNFEPRRITVPGHGPNVVTCLQFDDEKIITGADDKMINIYNPEDGALIRVLEGHEGGVWALKYIGNQIVSGSTDRTVRVWNIQTGKCTHVFRGHTSTIRCMEIVTADDGERYIITGSRDNTLHVWKLPDESDQGEHFDDSAQNNPYFVTVLRGHSASVRAVTGHGNIIVSGSYDHSVRVWDLKERKAIFVLRGHTDRIYSTILDIKRNRCISASMDSTIKVWDLSNGECIADLTKHTSLVGLLGLSASYLVSAAADGTLRGWDPEKYSNKFVLHQDNHAAITTFHATPNFLVSGSEGQFNVYDLRNSGKLIRSNVLPDAGPIWSAKFNDSKCVIAVEKNSHSFIEILDFSKRA